ncbi:hypothetical protein Tco_1221017 [Tanacetum coccineum]
MDPPRDPHRPPPAPPPDQTQEHILVNLQVHYDYSLPDYEAFYLNDDHIEEKSSGGTTTHDDFSQYDSFIFDLLINPFPPADRSDFYHEKFAGELAHIISPSEYDHFYFKIEPELGNFTMDVVEDIFDNPTREPRVHVLHDLPTHPTLHLDSDFTLSSDSPRSDLVVSFPSTKNNIFDLGIFIEVESKKFLSWDEFYTSFICDPLSSVIDTLLSFLSKNEDKLVNSGILAADEEKSPHPSSHWGLRAFNESPMMIFGEDIHILGVPFLHFFPPRPTQVWGIDSSSRPGYQKQGASWVATHAYPSSSNK